MIEDSLGNIVHKFLVGIEIIFLILEVVDVVDLNVGDDRIGRCIGGKMTAELIGFDAKILAVLAQVAFPVADQIAGLLKGGNNRLGDRCRGGLAMRSGNTDGSIVFHQFTQKLVIAVALAQFSRFNNFREVL